MKKAAPCLCPGCWSPAHVAAAALRRRRRRAGGKRLRLPSPGWNRKRTRIVRASRRENGEWRRRLPAARSASRLRGVLAHATTNTRLRAPSAAYSQEELHRRLPCSSSPRISEDGAGVDCIKYDGTPIYQPGYGSMGANPVADGAQFTVGVAWHTYPRRPRMRNCLRSAADGPLVMSLRALPRNPNTGLVHISAG